jgi:hypothetical protein
MASQNVATVILTNARNSHIQTLSQAEITIHDTCSPSFREALRSGSSLLSVHLHRRTR